MKKVLIAVACLTGAISLSAQACPPGTHPVGGTGPHHKGGTCVTNNGPAHSHHEAKSSKKSHPKSTHHQDAASKTKRNRAPQPEQQPVNDAAEQAPARS